MPTFSSSRSKPNPAPITPIEPTIDEGIDHDHVPRARDHVAARRRDILDKNQHRDTGFLGERADAGGKSGAIAPPEPPGELIKIATAWMLRAENARSNRRATEAIVMLGDSGVEYPITPDKRTTGTTGIAGRRMLSGNSGRMRLSRRSVNVAVMATR